MSIVQRNEEEFKVIIHTSIDGGGLKDAIDKTGIGHEAVKSLTINTGTLNAEDCDWMNRNLVNLEALEVGEAADFENSTVPSSAFSGNKVLKSVKIMKATTVSKNAFSECSSLLNANLPQVTTLDNQSFNNCKTLEYANVPKLKSIESRAFYSCSALVTLNLGEEPPELLGRGYWFKNVYTAKIYVPVEAAIQKYKDTYEFADFKIKVIGDDSEDVDDGEDPLAHVYEQISTSEYLVDSRQGHYYTGDYKIGLNFYSFSHNLGAWLKGSTQGAPPIDTMEVIRFAKDAGFESVDVTSYYIPGYDNHTMPTKSDDEIMHYAKKIRALCEELGIAISGTGVQNDFADPNYERRALDIKRIKFWIDVAAVMGAPVMRVFNGLVPRDIMRLGWDAIARDRIAPALRECAEYGAEKGVMIGMQNHGDMTATADQVIRILKWVDHPNIGVINDTGYFRTFRDHSGAGYNWYDDIEAILPYTVNFQVKRKPAGQETSEPLVDLEELFTRIRYSSYRGYIPLELLWINGDAGHPKDLAEPPYEQVRDFLAQLKAASESTKTKGPSS